MTSALYVDAVLASPVARSLEHLDDDDERARCWSVADIVAQRDVRVPVTRGARADHVLGRVVGMRYVDNEWRVRVRIDDVDAYTAMLEAHGRLQLGVKHTYTRTTRTKQLVALCLTRSVRALGASWLVARA